MFNSQKSIYFYSNAEYVEIEVDMKITYKYFLYNFFILYTVDYHKLYLLSFISEFEV
jgi:hypothetical protein